MITVLSHLCLGGCPEARSESGHNVPLWWLPLRPPLVPAENEASDSGSDSDVDVKKTRHRHRLLRHKLSLSEGESGEEKPAGKAKKEGKRKTRRKGRRGASSAARSGHCALVLLQGTACHKYPTLVAPVAPSS